MASNICARLRAGVTTGDAATTRALAGELAAVLPDGTILALHGDLGVGKTTFVQGLAHGLGIQEPVTSPTFNLFTLHAGPERRLLHLDAYRLSEAAQMDALMLEDFMIGRWIAAIEWPERIAAWLPADAWHLDLGIEGDQHTVRLR